MIAYTTYPTAAYRLLHPPKPEDAPIRDERVTLNMFWLSALTDSKSNNGEAFITWKRHCQTYDVVGPSVLLLNCHILCQKL